MKNRGWNYLRRRANQEDAADLTAEVFTQALLSRRRFRAREHETALPWLLGIARNVLRHHARHASVADRARRRLGMRRIQVADDDVEAEVVKIVDGPFDRQRLVRALDDLPPTLAVAVRLRVLDERTYREVAHELACSEGAARVRVCRGLRQLAQQLEGRTCL